MSTAFYVAFALLWVVVVALGVLVLLLYRHFGLMAMETYGGVQRDGLKVGTRAPSFTGREAFGDLVTFKPERPVSSLLVFVTPECGPCQEILPVVDTLAAGAVDGLEVLGVASGNGVAVRGLASRLQLRFPCVMPAGAEDIARLYEVDHTPFAFVVGPEGRIRAKGLCNDRPKLAALLEQGGAPGAEQIERPSLTAAPEVIA